MDRQTEHRHLEQAERHIAENERRITEQKSRIVRLDADGHDTRAAVRLLETLRNLRSQYVEHRKRILKELEK
jgi:hypothetical protein